MRGAGLLLLLAACTGQSASPAAGSPAPGPASTPRHVTGQPETLTYEPALGVDLQLMTRTVSGLYYRDTQIGRGAIAGAGSRVRVAYQGWLADGSLFDESAEGFVFPLGRGRVIGGWDEGVQGMKVGGRRMLVIPPALGYGSQSPGGGIPPNATLVFQVMLLTVD